MLDILSLSWVLFTV